MVILSDITNEDENKNCFVICPIGNEDSDTRKRSDITFEHIIKPVVEKHGYTPIRADHISESGMISTQIIDHVINSALVIADLTDSNPNVYYELALRHSVQKPYIQMINLDQTIPFDISGMRTIFFDLRMDHGNDAKDELYKQIESIQSGKFNAANPITLAHNFSAVQRILSEKVDTESDNVTTILLESVSELMTMMDGMKADISNLKRSSDFPKSLKGPDPERASLELEEQIDYLTEKYRKYRELLDEMEQNGTSGEELSQIAKKTQHLKTQLEFLEDKRRSVARNVYQFRLTDI